MLLGWQKRHLAKSNKEEDRKESFRLNDSNALLVLFERLWLGTQVPPQKKKGMFVIPVKGSTNWQPCTCSSEPFLLLSNLVWIWCTVKCNVVHPQNALFKRRHHFCVTINRHCYILRVCTSIKGYVYFKLWSPAPLFVILMKYNNWKLYIITVKENTGKYEEINLS